jgi:hypothetical protein
MIKFVFFLAFFCVVALIGAKLHSSLNKKVQNSGAVGRLLATFYFYLQPMPRFSLVACSYL